MSIVKERQRYRHKVFMTNLTLQRNDYNDRIKHLFIYSVIAKRPHEKLKY